MNNQDTLATLDTQDTGRRQTIQQNIQIYIRDDSSYFKIGPLHRIAILFLPNWEIL